MKTIHLRENVLYFLTNISSVSSSLECIITGNPIPEFFWLHNERKIGTEEGFDKKSETLNAHTARHRLSIAAKQKKLGTYKAQGQNNFGHTISTCQVRKAAHSIDQRKRAAFEEAELQVPAPNIQRRRSSVAPLTAEQLLQITQPPIVVQGLGNLQVDMNSPCALTCKSKNDAEQKWMKDGQQVVSSKAADANVFTKIERSNDGNTHILNVKQFRQENCGNYELILKNDLGEVKTQGKLEMKGIPPTFTVEPQTTAAVKGKMAEFNCRVQGSPKPDVRLTLSTLNSSKTFSSLSL